MKQKSVVLGFVLVMLLAPSRTPLSANLAGSDANLAGSDANLAGSDAKKPQKTSLGKCQDAADESKKDCEARCKPESSGSTEGGGDTSGGSTTTAGLGKLSTEEDEAVRECLDHCDREFRRMQGVCYKRNTPAKK
jgi:hypothetical protein